MEKFNNSDKNKIVERLNNNDLIIIATDTVYGIMAKANKENEKKINTIKNSNINKKISIIFPNKDILYSYLYDISYYKKEYMNDKLPGKYTFIVKLKNFSDFEREDFGVRITENKFLQEILEEVGPVLASSCNRTGNKSINNINDIEKEFINDDIAIVASEIDENLDTPSSIINLINDIEIVR